MTGAASLDSSCSRPIICRQDRPERNSERGAWDAARML